MLYPSNEILESWHHNSSRLCNFHIYSYFYLTLNLYNFLYQFISFHIIKLYKKYILIKNPTMSQNECLERNI